MGYRIPVDDTYLLDFQRDPRFDGLQVEAEGMTIAELDRLTASGFNRKATYVEARRLFAERLVAWNAEDPRTGEPVPVPRDLPDTDNNDDDDGEGLHPFDVLPARWLQSVVWVWVNEVTDIDPPVAPSLRNGAGAPPMETVPLAPTGPNDST